MLLHAIAWLTAGPQSVPTGCRWVKGHHQFLGQAQALFRLGVPQSFSIVQLLQFGTAVRCSTVLAATQGDLGKVTLPDAKSSLESPCIRTSVFREFVIWTHAKCELNDE